MRLADTRDTNPITLLAALVAVMTLAALLNRFVQDDAFISFQYARNLVEGHGLTFNPGERVEGYTNFLWTLLMAAGIAIGIDAIAWSFTLGLVFFAGSLVTTYLLARVLSGSTTAGLIATGLLGTNFSFNAYATGGLETQMQAFLVVAAVTLSWRVTGEKGGSLPLLAVTSAVYGLAVLTRLDSAVCLIPPGILVLVRLLRAGGTAAGRLSRLVAFCLPAVSLLAPWLAWKLSYYGDILPNTFYVKVASSASLARGGHYVYRFFATYWLLPLVVFALLARPRRIVTTLRAQDPPWGTTLVATLLAWSAYVAYVGGDFMEFRFMVPVLPILMALVGWSLVAVVEDRRVRAAVIGVVLLGSAFHGLTFWGVRDIESVRSLAIHMEPDGGDWDEVGRVLGEHFGPDQDVVIAVGPAGAIPYYSRLESVDMRGLIDPWVARNGIIVSTVPGHQRMAPVRYLVERGVDLVVGHPQVVSRREGLPEAFSFSWLARLALADASPQTVPQGARILAIPMTQDRMLLALYLTEDDAIERAIARKGWSTVPLTEATDFPGAERAPE